MKRVMHRLFWAWDFDREEDWLNAWAARGWALVDVCGFRYVFEESAPGEYEYRLELLEHATSNAESRCYLDFLRDLDIECIGSYGRWTYQPACAMARPLTCSPTSTPRSRICAASRCWC